MRNNTYFLLEKENKFKNILDFIILTLFILYTAGAASILENDVFTVIIFIFLFIVFVFRKRKNNKFIWKLLGIWFIINIISYFINTPFNFSFTSFFGVTLRMLMAYVMIKDIGPDFFDKFFKYAYVLVVISLPLFILEQSFPSLFSSVAPVFRFMTGREQVAAEGFYSFIYMHNGWAWKDFRNSGFMWEPGGYACLLIFLLYYYWFKKGLIIDNKAVVIFLALLSTFSTAGYLALFFAIILFVVKNKNLRKNPIILISLLAVAIYGSIYFYKKSDFMSKKIDTYVEEGTNSYEWSFQDQRMIRVSRLGIAIISLDNAIYNPIGDGVIYSNYIRKKYGEVAGPNSLAEILRQWGWLGLVILFFTLFKFAKIYTSSTLCRMFFVMSMCIVLFSNPFMFKYIIYAILFFIV